MRILCLIPALNPGGAERVMSYLVTYLSMQHEVTLITLEPEGTRPFYDLPGTIRVIQLNLLGGAGWLNRAVCILSRFRAIHRQVKHVRPDVVLSFMDTMNITAIVSSLGSGTPVVVSERVDPSHHRIGIGKSFLRWFVYPLADCCVVQTDRIKNYFNRVPRPRLIVIPNPVPVPSEKAEPAFPNSQGQFRVIALGRLDKQKGYDLLLDAFACVAPIYRNWHLTIFGEGSERAALEAQIGRHALTGRVHLPGVTSKVWSELAASHILAFPSRYEGFPNALAEGMATGLPPIGRLDVSGVEDLIINKETGLLFGPKDNAAALAEALEYLMKNACLRSKLGAKAREHMHRWRSDTIFQQWETLLIGTAEKKKKESRVIPRIM